MQEKDGSLSASYRWGSLTFVGASTGDCELLTIAGARALSEADLIICDPELDISEFSNLSSADFIKAGEDQYQKITAALSAGNDVVRLVTSDLFIDGGSLGLLAKCLQTNGVRINVIPGVDRYTAVGSFIGYCGSPCAVFVDARKKIKNWPKAESIFVHSKGKRLSRLVKETNRPVNETVLLVQNPGSIAQTTQLVTWEELAELNIEGEIYLLAGSAVDKRNGLDWFSTKPLLGWRVLIPVTKADHDVLSYRLQSYGALPQEVPTLSIEPPRNETQLEKAVRGIVDGHYGWLVFTSPHAAKAIRRRIEEFGLDSRALSGVRVAAVNQRTVRELEKWGLLVDLEPQGEQTAACLADYFPAFDEYLDPINRVLVPKADIATDLLMDGLEALGWEVEDVVAYRSVRAAPPPSETREAIKAGSFDAVVFSSATAVRNMIGIAGKPHSSSVIIAIGPETKRTCIEHGLRVDGVAAQPTARSLVDCLADFAIKRREKLLKQGQPITMPSAGKKRKYRKRKIRTG